jgi:hypothetical protein
MSLITRIAKGNKLTIAEMDGNLEYLQANGFVDGEYTQTGGNIEIRSRIQSTGEVIAEELEFSEIETDALVANTYTDIEPTGGSGTGLVVTVEVSGESTPTIAQVTVTAGGTGYQPGDVVSIATSELGANPSTESTTVILESSDLSAENQQRILITPTGIFLPDLPTSDPSVEGQLWNDSGSLKIDSNLSNPLKSAEVTLTKAQINDLHNTTVSFPASQLGVAANEHYKIIIELTEIRTNPDRTGFGQGGARPGFTMAYNNTPLCTIPYASFAPSESNIVSFRPTPIDSIISTVTNAPLTFATSEAITNGGADAEIKIKIFFYTFVP